MAIGSRYIKNAYGYIWRLVFHHNVAGNYFSSSEVLSINTEHKYSILGKLDEYRINGNFTFLLEYPEYSGYIMCIQSTNPAKNAQIKDFVLLHNTWKDGIAFEGFALTGNSFTFIDGSPHNSSLSFHAIGQYFKWGSWQLAAAYDYYHPIKDFNIVDLWVQTSPAKTFDTNVKKLSHIIILYNILLLRKL